MDENKTKKEQQIVGIVGVGLDNEDEHKRITKNEDVILVGGSKETHEHMQEISIKFNESLRDRGKRLKEVEPDEAADLWLDATDD